MQSCSAKLLPKAAPQSCSPALLHKIVPKAVLQSCCPKAAESCSPKLLPKIAPQSCVLIATPQRCSPKLRFFKAAVQSCSSKLLPKAVPLRCSTKLCPKTVLQSCCPKSAILKTCLPTRLPKAILHSGSRQLRPKVAKPAPDSCFRKRLLKVAFQCHSPKLSFFKATVRQCCCNAATLLPTVSCSPTSESCSPKHLCKAVAPKRLPKAAPQSCPQWCSPKLRFFKAAVQSCSSSKLLPKAVPLRCSTKLCPKKFSKVVAPMLRKAAPQSCCCPKLPAGLESCPKLHPNAAAQNCSPALLPKVVPQSYSPKLLP